MRSRRSPTTSRDVIFVDIMMPRLDGYQTCALIKQNPQAQVDAGDHAVVEGRRVRPCARPAGGSDRYLTKPFTKEGLVEAVDEHVKPHISVAS